jgi:hypothetical protein
LKLSHYFREDDSGKDACFRSRKVIPARLYWYGCLLWVFKRQAINAHALIDKWPTCIIKRSKEKIEDIINYDDDEVRFVKLSWKISTEDDYDIDVVFDDDDHLIFLPGKARISRVLVSSNESILQPPQFPEYASPGLGSLVLSRKD